MNHKGLTLVELLAVIVVLAVVALIVTPNILSSISKSHERMYETQLDNIKSAAKNWAADIIHERHCLICIPENNLSTNLDCSNGGEGCIEAPKATGRSTVVTLAALIDGGYVKEELKNPKTEKPFNRCLEVVITVDVDTGDYIYTIPDPDTTVSCSL